MSEDRLTWSLIADILIENCIAKSKNIRKELTVNTFIQSWHQSTNGKYDLPTNLKRMISVAKKYNVRLDVLVISEKIKRDLPAWYHVASNRLPRGFIRRKATNCLQTKHRAKSISDILRITKRLNNADPNNPHQDLKDCQCAGCSNDRREGCSDPNACVRAAETILESLPPKFSPTSSKLNNDRLSLTPQHIKKNEEERKKENGIITFNPSI